MNARAPSGESYYSQHHPPPAQPPSSQTPTSTHLPGISRHYAQSPELERMSVSGPSYHTGPLPALQQQSQPPSRHDPLPPNGSLNPASNRGSPVFLPPHRTSTPDNHSHRRTSSYSEHISRGPPQDTTGISHQSVHQQPPQQSMSQQPHQHHQQQHHIRGMPPPSSPHRISLSHSQSSQALRHSHPPPAPTALHQHSAPPGPSTPGFGPSPVVSSRDLPAPHRPSMSISSMLDSTPVPPPSASTARQSDISPLKGGFAPEFPPLDRSREVGSSSASPSSGNTPLSGLPRHKKSRMTPPEPVYRAHQQLLHHSGVHNLDRDAPYAPPLYGKRPPPSHVPTRPQSQPPAIHGMRDDGPARPLVRSGSFSEREIMYDRERQFERDRYLEKEIRDRETREREAREREARERDRQHKERERDRERERAEGRVREREREIERHQVERERERKRERERERGSDRRGSRESRFGSVTSTFGRERMELQVPPHNASSPLPYAVTIPSRYGGSNGGSHPAAPPPPVSISTPGVMTLQTSSSVGGQGHHRPTPPPLSTTNSTPRENFQPFSGYNVSMPQSPFSISPSLPLPAVGDDARDRDARPQRFKQQRDVGTPTRSTGGRDEPPRAEDALQRGLNRSLSSLIEDDKKRNVGKDRDGIIKDKDGFMRLTDSVMTYQSPPRRSTGGGFGDIGRAWSDLLPKELLINREREDRDRLVGSLGVKRDREDDSSSKIDKKKRHHHHHQHPHLHLNHHHHHEDISMSLETNKNYSNAVRSKSPLHPHHHHAHIHHHHSPLSNSSQLPLIGISNTQNPLPKTTTTLLIDSTKVLASLTSKPRNYLGSMVYLPTSTPKQGYSVTQPLMPRFDGKENSIFQIRIPKRFLADLHRKDVSRRRCVWGTEIYTDDSDVLGVLIHTGRIPPVLPDDADPMLLKEFNRKIIIRGSTSAHSPPPPPPAGGNWKPNSHIVAKKNEADAEIRDGKDLLVNLLILPRLERYTGTSRNSFKSRSWKTLHDGMSYSIWDIEWVDAGEAESRGGISKKRRLNEREWVRRWGELPASRGGMGNDGWTKGRWTLNEARNENPASNVEVGA